MTAFLNITLLVIGTMATLAAFGGLTCREGPEPFLSRVTPRGWISLICLILALAIGTVKELITQREDAHKEAAVAKEKAEAGQKQAAQSLQLADSNAQLDLARKSLEDLRQIDQLTQDRLSDTRTTLEDVRKSLGSTRDDLTQQSAANVVTSLANVNASVKEVLLYIPLTARANASPKFSAALLPSFPLGACRDLTGTEVDIGFQFFKTERIIHEAADANSEHDYFKDTIPKAEFVIGPLEPQEIASIQQIAGQGSTNAFVYALAINTTHSSLSAAQWYARLSKPGAAPVSISMSWPAAFKTRQAYQDALQRYPDILTRVPGDSAPGELVEPHATRPYPSACSEEVQRYFRTAFDKAALVLIMDHNEEIVFKLKALPLKKVNGDWSLNFGIASTAAFGALDEANAKFLASIFPPDPKTDPNPDPKSPVAPK